MRVIARMRSHSKAATAARVILSIAFGAAAAVAIEAEARARLDDGVLRAPTRFYARPIVIYPGMTLERDRVEGALERLGYRRSRSRDVGIGEYRLSSRYWTIGRRAFRHYDQIDPGGVATIRVSRGGQVASVEDANGRRLRYFALEPELIRSTYGPSYQDRVPVRLPDVPERLVEAILTIEDQHFFQHPGLDLKRIAGATLANLRARRVVQGASTVTQQLAKNLYLYNRRSPIRKLREIAMALTLERRHSKEEILEAYLNQVYLGQDGGLAVHGVGRAAQFYFGKDVSQLSLSEAALLAGIIRGPSLYSPFRHPDAAKERRDLVLRLMREREVISEDSYKRARRARLRLRERPPRTRHGRYFVDFVSRQVAANHGRGALREGLAVFTTLDMDLQRVAEDAVRSGLARLERDYRKLAREDVPLQAALVALDPRSGEILAMVGGRDFGKSQFNRAVRAHRQPGSSFKPIVALAALTGRSFTLATMLEDEPLSLETPAGLWQPVNYDKQFRGPVSFREALERSLNVPFARIGVAIGPDRIVQTARKLGIESRLNPVPSLALGSSEVTPLEMARAFGVMAANGFRADLHPTLGVLDREGNVLERLEVTGDEVYSPAETYLVTSALEGAVERGTGQALRRLGYRGSVAAKSGTTNNFRDAWFIGYTPTLAVAVWVGFDDGRSIGAPGSGAALPIFARFLVGALGRYGGRDFSMPAGLEVVEVDRDSGLRAGPGCWGEREVFLPGTAPQRSCSPYWASERWDRSRETRRSSEVVLMLEELGRRLRRGRN
ncbi:MAG: PBP1A family penicillin-binding protein [Gemmatimonadales bacterium]|nr:PBP1A family penicillin-binding protein [Gemmatimonadales bacterium]NIR02914.1 PBP1A family penicillin-binding protein [Gemmatimonadales bacterium]